VAFRARVGGGLSTSPRFSKDLGVLVQPEEVVELCAAIARRFRDEGNRKNRKKARSEVPRRAVGDPALPSRGRAEARPRASGARRSPRRSRSRERRRVPPRRQPSAPGRAHYVGLALLGGRTSGNGAQVLADLAERYGSGRVRTTVTQDILIPRRPGANLERSSRSSTPRLPPQPGLGPEGDHRLHGRQFCKLAVAATKNHRDRGRRLPGANHSVERARCVSA
jgi:sulfite reductase (ferredoxin)